MNSVPVRYPRYRDCQQNRSVLIINWVTALISRYIQQDILDIQDIHMWISPDGFLLKVTHEYVVDSSFRYGFPGYLSLWYTSTSIPGIPLRYINFGTQKNFKRYVFQLQKNINTNI